MASVVVKLLEPVDAAFIKEQNLKIIRQELSAVYISVIVGNRYTGDDETILYNLDYLLLRTYRGEWSVVWQESDY